MVYMSNSLDRNSIHHHRKIAMELGLSDITDNKPPIKGKMFTSVLYTRGIKPMQFTPITHLHLSMVDVFLETLEINS